jgi:hypothetical protein
VRGSKDRVKDASSERLQRCADAPCIRFVAHADDVPLLGILRTSAVIGAPSASGGYPWQSCGPTEAFVPTTPREECRLPENRDVFHRHDTRRSCFSEGIAPSGLRAGSLAHAAHTLSQGWGQCFGRALQGTAAVTRVVRAIRECKRLWYSLELRAWS